MKWETHKGITNLLGLWTPTLEKLRDQATPEEGGVGPCGTLTLIVSGLAGKLGCVKSPVLVKNCGQLLCKELSAAAGVP